MPLKHLEFGFHHLFKFANLRSSLTWIALGILGIGFTNVNAFAATVLTQHNDLAQTGANLTKTNLTTASVNSNAFGLCYTRPVADQIYDQPLVMTDVVIPGVGARTVVYTRPRNRHDFFYPKNS